MCYSYGFVSFSTKADAQRESAGYWQHLCYKQCIWVSFRLFIQGKFILHSQQVRTHFNPTTLPQCALLQIAMGPLTTLFPNFMLVCKRFHSISVLTANFPATSDTFPQPLNHLTAIFSKTSTFCLLPIYHPPFLHLSFFTHSHLPLCLQAAMEMMAPSAPPHISQCQAPATNDGFANSCWGRI